MLYDLQERYKLLVNRKTSLENQIELLNVRMENIGAINMDKVSVKGRGIPITIDDLINQKSMYEEELSYINEALPIVQKEVLEAEKILEERNDRDQMIYYYKKIKDWSCIKIGMKFGLSEVRVRDIVRNIDNNMTEAIREMFVGVKK